MDAEAYTLSYWRPDKAWEHLDWPAQQRRFVTIAKSLEGLTALDVGCATGHSTMHLQTFYPQARWYGLDFSQTAVDAARKTFPDIPFYFAPDFNLLPVCGPFDAVVCSEVLAHVPHDAALAAGLLRITRQILVVTVPCQHPADADPGRLRLYTEDALIKLFRGALVAVRKAPPFFYLVARPARRA